VALSGGQSQLLAITRAAVRKTPFYLLDEPNSAVDPNSEAIMMTAVNELAANAGVMFVTHRYGIVSQDSRVVMFGDSKILCDGRCSDLMLNNQEFSTLVNASLGSWVEK